MMFFLLHRHPEVPRENELAETTGLVLTCTLVASQEGGQVDGQKDNSFGKPKGLYPRKPDPSLMMPRILPARNVHRSQQMLTAGGFSHMQNEHAPAGAVWELST